MSLELLKSNLEREKRIVNEIAIFSNKTEELKKQGLNFDEISLLEDTIRHLLKELDLVNKAIPEMINRISFYKQLSEKSKKKEIKGVIKVSYKEGEDKVQVAVKEKDKVPFLDSITRSKDIKERIKSKEVKVELKKQQASYHNLTPFIKLANRLFRKRSEEFVEKGYFKSINDDLRKISSPFLLKTYLSMMMLSTVSIGVFAFIIALILFIFKQFLIGILVLLGLPLFVLSVFLLYPSIQKRSFSAEINNELPFVTIYMSAIATSGIEPSKIFSILVRTKDYPATTREVKRLLNYINFYGYDLVSALRMASKKCPSGRLSMLFNGLATTIRSGGELTDFLDKHSEGLLFDYRLEREKYTKLAETFMDIYISILIAAPMILMILFILLLLTGYSSEAMTPFFMTFSIVGIIVILNISFLVFLNYRQPKF